MQHISHVSPIAFPVSGYRIFRAMPAFLLACLICVAGVLFAAPFAAWAQTDPSEDFYYAQLTPDEQGFYDSLAAYSDEFAVESNTGIAIEVPSSAEIDVDRTVRAFFLDHPEVFWVDPEQVAFVKSAAEGSSGAESSVYRIDAGSPYFREGFDEASLSVMRDAFTSRIELATLGLTGTAADKAGYLKDWLSAYNAGWRSVGSGGRGSSAYAAIVDLPGTCDEDAVAYASAYKCLLDAAGIPSVIVMDVAQSQLEGPQPRVWNAVRIDGSYYAVDAMWELDPFAPDNMPCFLVGSDTPVVEGVLTGRTFGQTHTPSDSGLSGAGFAVPELAAGAYVEPDPVTVDAKTFPDDALRAWLLDPRNALGSCADGMLTASEAANVVELDVSGLDIESLEGIGHFASLRTLDCSDNRLQVLDLSANADISRLDASDNSLVELDLSQAVHLDGASLDVTGNVLERLVLPHAIGGSVASSAFASQRSAEGFLPPVWRIGDETGEVPGDAVALEGQTLVAVREPARYLIEFDGGEATGAMEPQVVSFGSDYTVPACGFEREGYRFAGWSAAVPDAEPQKLHTGETVSSLTAVDGARVVFSAVWEPVSYSVSFDPGSYEPAEGEPWPADVKAAYDQSFDLPVPDVEDASRLVGWCADSQGEGHIYVAGSQALNLAAQQGEKVALYAIWNENPLSALRRHALDELEAVYASRDAASYTAKGKEAFESAYAEGMTAIRAASTLSSVDSALASAVVDILQVKTKSEAVEDAVGSWRAEHSDILSAPIARSGDMDAIVAAINSASTLSEDAEVQSDVSVQLADDVESLTEKREVSAAKTLRLETLKGLYDGYDLSSFDGEGAALITTAYQEGVRAIDAAVSVADVETETETARLALAQAAQQSAGEGALIGPSALSGMGQDSSSEQGEGSGQAALGTSSFFLLLFLICGITGLCVLYANVRDKARARQR